MGPRTAESDDIYIQFDGRQVHVETDVNEVAHFIRDSHSAMINPGAGQVVGRIVVLRAEGGYRVDAQVFEGDRPGMLFEMLKQRIAALFVNSRPDLFWLHSGVVTRGSRALLIVGPSGQGKSSLSIFLCRAGWRYLSDELAPIQINGGTVLPYPRSPVRRIPPGRYLATDEMGAVETETWPVPAGMIGTEAAIGSILFPEFAPGGETIVGVLTPGEASLGLIRNAFHSPGDRAHGVAASARLASVIPCRSIRYADVNDAARVLQGLDTALFGRPQNE
ncbi:MAG TPA: hypothetical protein VHM24_09190 [Gemmatimonadaceae bacterium]|nr:hypothetical protein [Gemmatimonadaceae bacterium]